MKRIYQATVNAKIDRTHCIEAAGRYDMNIGIFTDLHSNAIALEALLKVFAHKDCQELIFCGDAIGIGPFPQETIERLLELENIHFVVGNHESYMDADLGGQAFGKMTPSEAAHHRWQHSHLHKASKEAIMHWPKTLSLLREGFHIVVTHYALQGKGYAQEVPNPNFFQCQKLFGEWNRDVVCYGHDHRGGYAAAEGAFFINPGSAGCPHAPLGIAKGGILTLAQWGISYTPIEASYDLSAVIHAVDRLQYPDYEMIRGFFYGVPFGSKGFEAYAK